MQITETDHVRKEYAATATQEGVGELVLNAIAEDSQAVISLSGAGMRGVSITLPLAALSPLADFIQSVIASEGAAE